MSSVGAGPGDEERARESAAEAESLPRPEWQLPNWQSPEPAVPLVAPVQGAYSWPTSTPPMGNPGGVAEPWGPPVGPPAGGAWGRPVGPPAGRGRLAPRAGGW